MHDLKSITAAGVTPALEKAERYRLLNDPTAAETIGLDVLEVEAGNQRALVTLLLARTDQFGSGHGAGVAEAREVLPRLGDPYLQAYYAGVIAERRGRALLASTGVGGPQMAADWFREAMEHYEAAEAIRPAGNDDALLRWNTCARILNANPALAHAEAPELSPITGD